MRIPPVMHHVAVQTADLDNAVSWYVDYFHCQQKWSTSTFSPITLSRLPGMRRVTELALGDMRFHLFERAGAGELPAQADAALFQHLCLSADSSANLRQWRTHWIDLHASGRYSFVRPEQPSDIVIDDDGVESFYFFDTNGLEFEFTWAPEGPR